MLTATFGLLALRWAVVSFSDTAQTEKPDAKPGAARLAQAAPTVPTNAPAASPDTPPASLPPAALPPRVVPPVLPPPTPAPPQVKAASAILVDAATGQVLYYRNADVPRPMASTTKIMTALLFCEAMPETALVTASENAAKTHESSLHLKKGEVLTAHDLLRAMLMRSANDACVAAAERVAGTETAFADQMNRKAAELGCTHTHFVNSHGLHDDLHYTTARDLALIARAAMLEPRIAEVVGTKRCRISRSLDHDDVTLRNHSHFLGKFPGADGIKTGYTVPAGHCYVGSATHNGWRLISVVLKSPDYVGETSAMMQYGFQNYQNRVLVKAGATLASCKVENGLAQEVSAVAGRDLQYVTRKTANAEPIPAAVLQTHFAVLTAPIAAGAAIGTAQIVADGKILSEQPLLAKEAVAALPPTLASRMSGSRRGRFLLGALLFGAGLVSFRYGKRYIQRNRAGNRGYPAAKGARRRRSRFT